MKEIEEVRVYKFYQTSKDLISSFRFSHEFSYLYIHINHVAIPFKFVIHIHIDRTSFHKGFHEYMRDKEQEYLSSNA